MNRKHVSTMAAALALLACTGWAAQPEAETELMFNARVLSPAKTEDWDSAGGVEVQMRFWNPSNVGIGLSLAFDQWNARNDFYDTLDEYGYFSMAVDGEADVVNAGISALIRTVINHEVNVVLDAGLRYAMVSSDIYTTATVSDTLGAVSYRDRIEVENSLMGQVGITVEVAIGEGAWLRGGFGYQFDLGEPRETYLGTDIGATSFDAAIVTFGIGWSF